MGTPGPHAGTAGLRLPPSCQAGTSAVSHLTMQSPSSVSRPPTPGLRASPPFRWGSQGASGRGGRGCGPKQGCVLHAHSECVCVQVCLFHFARPVIDHHQISISPHQWNSGMLVPEWPWGRFEPQVLGETLPSQSQLRFRLSVVTGPQWEGVRRARVDEVLRAASRRAVSMPQEAEGPWCRSQDPSSLCGSFRTSILMPWACFSH